MIDEKKVKCIELMIDGEHNKTEIAKIIGIDRTTIYNWLQDKEFTAAFDSRLQEVNDLAHKEFNAKLPKAIDEYWKLAMTTNDSRTKETALYKWIERSLGKVSSNLVITPGANKVEVDDDTIEQEINELEEGIE